MKIHKSSLTEASLNLVSSAFVMRCRLALQGRCKLVLGVNSNAPSKDVEIFPSHSKIRAIKLWQHLYKADHKSVRHKALFSNTTCPNKNSLTQFALHVKNNADIRQQDDNSQAPLQQEPYC